MGVGVSHGANFDQRETWIWLWRLLMGVGVSHGPDFG